MTETGPGYHAGGREPEHHWVECSARLPSELGDTEVQTLAKIRCDDVIDALDLPRWSAVAFQHLWRSATTSKPRRHQSLALWYLKRACSGHHAEARCIARVIRKLVAIADERDENLRDVLLAFASDAEAAEFEASELIHQEATKEH